MMRTDYWPDDRSAALRALWNEGKSASQAAQMLGVSRNAVMGRLNRMGLLGFRRFEAGTWNGSIPMRQPPTPPRAFSWEQHA